VFRAGTAGGATAEADAGEGNDRVCAYPTKLIVTRLGDVVMPAVFVSVPVAESGEGEELAGEDDADIESEGMGS